MTFAILDPTTTRDLRCEVLDAFGRLRVLPSAYWMQTSMAERALLGHRLGLYAFPSTELVTALREVCMGGLCIEVCAGRGDLCAALGVAGFDNRMQNWPSIANYYAATGQPTIPYGDHVLDGDANEVARELRPTVIIAAWMTHRYDPARHSAGGNQHGPDHDDLLAHCDRLVFIGNTTTHAAHPLLRRPHRILPVRVFSRATDGEDFAAVFEGVESTAIPRQGIGG